MYEHEVKFPASTKIYKLAFSCEPFYKVDSWPDGKEAGKLDVLRCHPEVDGRIYRFSGNGFRFPTQDEVIQEANIKNQMKKAVDFEDDSRGVHLNEYYKPETKIVCSAE